MSGSCRLGNETAKVRIDSNHLRLVFFQKIREKYMISNNPMYYFFRPLCVAFLHAMRIFSRPIPAVFILRCPFKVKVASLEKNDV